jgi:hypothetical protein
VRDTVTFSSNGGVVKRAVSGSGSADAGLSMGARMENARASWAKTVRAIRDPVGPQSDLSPCRWLSPVAFQSRRSPPVPCTPAETRSIPLLGSRSVGAVKPWSRAAVCYDCGRS